MVAPHPCNPTQREPQRRGRACAFHHTPASGRALQNKSFPLQSFHFSLSPASSQAPLVFVEAVYLFLFIATRGRISFCVLSLSEGGRGYLRSSVANGKGQTVFYCAWFGFVADLCGSKWKWQDNGHTENKLLYDYKSN